MDVSLRGAAASAADDDDDADDGIGDACLMVSLRVTSFRIGAVAEKETRSVEES